MFNVIFRKPAFNSMITLLSVILMTLTSTAQAFQTLDNQNISLSGYFNFSYTQQRAETFKLTDDKLVRFGREIIKPTIVPAIPTNSGYDNMKSLPDVPTAILMVLFGFICISLVRDRRIWLTAICSLLWVGQFCAETIPQLTKHLYLRTNINDHFSARHPLLYLFKNLTRPRCDIEGTRYIGLLHHLAGIPSDKNISYLYSQIADSNKSAKANLSPYPIFVTSHSTPTIKPFTYYKRVIISNNSSRAPPLI